VICLLEAPDPPHFSPRKSAALMAKELTFQQCFRDGGAVNRYERGPRAVAVVINGPRNEFLASAGLATDQNIYRFGGHSPNLFVNGLHDPAIAHQRVARVAFPRPNRPARS
jgi:hypothetical protein